MARFRNGDFILDSNQKLKIDTTEITTDNSKLDVNNPLTVQSLELQSGPEITSISNNYLSDSTSELMTSKAVQDYIEDTLSNYSVGTDAVGSITQTQGDILGSQLFYGANNVEIEQDIETWGNSEVEITLITDESPKTAFLLSNDLICLIKSVKVGSYYHLDISYRDTETGQIRYSTTLFESENYTSIMPYIFGRNSNILKSGGFVSLIVPNNSVNINLIAINSTCSTVILKEIPNTIAQNKLSICLLPNEDILLINSNDANNQTMSVFRVDFDTTSFITVVDSEPISGDEIIGKYQISNTLDGIYLGNNKVIFSIYQISVSTDNKTGITIFDISQKKFVKTYLYDLGNGTTGYYSQPYSCLITQDKKIVIFYTYSKLIISPFELITHIVLDIFDENLNQIKETQTLTELDFFQGIPVSFLLDDGKIALIYLAGGSGDERLGYALFDINGNLLFKNISLKQNLPMNSSLFMANIKNDRTVVFILKSDSILPIDMYSYTPFMTTDQINVGGVVIDEISSDPYNTSDNALLTSSAISTKSSSIKKNVASSLKPYISGDRNLGLEFSDKYNSILYSTPFLSGTYSAGAIVTDEGKLLVIFETNAEAKATVLDPMSAEPLNSTTFTIPGLMNYLDAAQIPLIRTDDGTIISWFYNVYDAIMSYLVAVDQNANEKISPYLIEEHVRSIVSLPNNELLVTIFTNVNPRTQISRFKVDSDSSSFIQITEWQDTDLPSVTDTYDIGNNKYMHTNLTSGDTSISITDINGTIIKQINLSSDGVLTRGAIFYNKVTNLIYAVGYYSTATNSRILTYNTDLILLDLYDLGGVAYNSTSDRSGAVLPNGDFVFGFGVTSVGNFLVVIKPDGKIIINETDSTNVPTGGARIYLPLLDGQTLMAASTIGTFNVVFYYKEMKEKPGKNQRLYKDYANTGAYDFKTTEYQKKTISDSVTKYGNTGVVVGTFSTGRYALIYTRNVSPYRPYMNIYDQNDNLIVDTKEIFLGNNMPPTGVVETPSIFGTIVEGFIDRNWIIAPFRNSTSGQGCVVIYDDEGNQVCDPLELGSGTNVTVGTLEDGKFYVLDYNSTYVQGTTTHPQIWQVNSDSSTAILISHSLRTSTKTVNVNKSSFVSKNRCVGSYSTNVGLWSMTGIGINKLSPSSGTSISGVPPCVLPDNKIIVLKQTGTGTYGVDPPYTVKSYTFQYDPIKENIMTVGLNEELFVSEDSFSGRTLARCNNGNVAVSIYDEYPLPSESAYRYGIALINGKGEALTPTEVLNEQSTAAYSKMTITTGFEGHIYTALATGSTGTFLFDKWLPIIRKDSPLKYGHDVKIVTSSTGITLDSTYLDQRVTYNVASTTLNVTVPSNTSDPLPIGFRCSFSRLNSGTVTFVAGGGVTIVSADSYLSLAATGSLAEITKIDTNTWLLTGDLA